MRDVNELRDPRTDTGAWMRSKKGAPILHIHYECEWQRDNEVLQIALSEALISAINEVQL